MNMLGLQIIFIVALILGILSLFGLDEWVCRFIAGTICIVYFGFMLGIGIYIAMLAVRMVPL